MARSEGFTVREKYNDKRYNLSIIGDSQEALEQFLEDAGYTYQMSHLSSELRFVIDSSSYKNVFDLTELMLKRMINQDKDIKEMDSYLLHKKCLENIIKLLNSKINPNIPVFISGDPIDSMIMKGDNGNYYVITSSKYYWDEWDGFDYDSLGFKDKIYKRMKKLWFYLPKYDVIGREKKNNPKYICGKEINHTIIKLEKGNRFCPICDKEKLRKYQLTQNIDKYLSSLNQKCKPKE